MYKLEGPHFQCMNNHYAKIENKEMKTIGVTDYSNQTHQSIFGRKMSKFNTPKN